MRSVSVLLLVTACGHLHAGLPPPRQPLTLTPDDSFRAAPPIPDAPRPWLLPEPEAFRLDNGLTILLARRAEAKTIALDFVCRDAGENGAIATAGLAAFAGSMIVDADNLSGAEEFRPRVSRDGAAFQLEIASTDLARALAMLAHAVTQPRFRTNALERLRLRYLSLLIRSTGSMEPVALNVARRQLYGEGHPLATPVEGRHGVINDLTADDVSAFYRERFRPKSCALVVAGNTTREAITPLLTTTFGQWRPATTAPRTTTMPPIESSPRRIALVPWFSGARSTVLLAHRGVLRTSLDYPVFAAIVSVLDGRLGARMSRTLREGRTPDDIARAWMDPSALDATLFIAAPAPSGQEKKSVEELSRTLDVIARTPVTSEELATAKATFIQSVEEAYGSEAETAGTIAALFSAALPQRFEATLVERVQAVTPEDIQRVAGAALKSDDARMVVVGEPRAAKRSLTDAGFGEIETVEPP